MDANGAKRKVFMQHENIIGYQDDYVQNPEKHPMDFLSDIFNEKGWAKKKSELKRTIIIFPHPVLNPCKKIYPEQH